MNEQRVDMDKAKSLLKKQVHNQAPAPGDYETGLDGLRLYRRDQANQTCVCNMYRPMIVKMVQGAKRAAIGDEEVRYGEDEVMVIGVDMPSTTLIVEATPEAPCLSMAIDLDKNLIAQLALEIPQQRQAMGSAVKGLLLQRLSADLLDAFLRLAELLDQPEKLRVLGPMIVREIHYLLLTGPNGQLLRSFHTMGSQSNQVVRAISWLKQNMATTIQVEELAGMANMAPSTFHRYFKEITTLSPLQFQKRLRLHEAQRLMLLNDLDASSAGAAVGYESLSQFNREYKRLFGDPPRKNIQHMRGETLFTARPKTAKTTALPGF